jgi:hypothetical protein
MGRGSGVSSIDERRCGASGEPVFPDERRAGGSSGKRAAAAGGGGASVGNRELIGGGVPASVDCDVARGGIVTVRGGELPVRGGELPVRGGELPVRGGALPVRSGELDERNGDVGELGREGAAGTGDAGRPCAVGVRDSESDGTLGCGVGAGARSGFVAVRGIDGTLGFAGGAGDSEGALTSGAVSWDSSALQRTSSGAISRIERHTMIACCLRP